MCFAWYLASSASVFLGRGRPQPAAQGGKAHPWHQPWECGRPSIGCWHTAHLGPRSAHCGHAASGPPPASGPMGLAWHIGQLSWAHSAHRQKGRCVAWYRCFLGRATFWQPAHGGYAQIDTTNLVLTMLAKVSRTVDKPYRQGTATLVCFWRGTGLPVGRDFVANCTRWIGAALAPRAWCRRWFQRCATLWADLGGRCLQVGGFPITLATNAVVGLGVILVQVGHTDNVPTHAALPGLRFAFVGLVQFTLFAAGFS